MRVENIAHRLTECFSRLCDGWGAGWALLAGFQVHCFNAAAIGTNVTATRSDAARENATV